VKSLLFQFLRVDVDDLVELGEEQSVDVSTDVDDARFYRVRVIEP
jgi:hypothetical protein